jgi:acyl carrier protein
MSVTLTSPQEVAAELIYPVIDELRSDFKADLPKEPGTPLLSEGTVLDSLSLVALLVCVEERIESETGHKLRLVNEKALSPSASPFRTLGSLADFVYELLDES